MTKEIDCAAPLQATADALLRTGACRLSILDALMTTAVSIARQDPDDPEWVHLIDPAQCLLEQVEVHRGKKIDLVVWKKKDT